MIQKRFKLLKSKTKLITESNCKNKMELKYLTITPGCSDDLAAVSALPEQWVSVRSGPILSTYLKQRELSHLGVLEDLYKDSRAVNKEINNKVKTLALALLADIQENERNINCIIDKCAASEKPLSSDDSKKELIHINILLTRRNQCMTNFKFEALCLERYRAAALKNILRLYFQQLIAIGHRTPTELLHEFDEKIYDINQQLMSNSRTNMLLEIKLRSQTDESLVRARSAINQLSLVVPTLRRNRSARPWSREQKYLYRSKSAIDSRSVHNSNAYDTTHQINDINSQNSLLEGYRDAIFKMFTTISGQLDELYKDIGERNIIARECGTSAIIAIQKIIENAGHSLGFRAVPNKNLLHRDHIEISRSSISTMQKSLFTFGDNLKDTYLMLHESGHLWDDHMLRLALAQKLTMATVEDLIVNNDAIQLANEVVTDIAIEQLRAAPDTDKLQQYFDVIIVSLDRTSDLLKQHSDFEIAKLEEFMNLISSLIKTLLAECSYFLERYPKSNVSEIKQASNTPPGIAIRSARLIVSKTILQTEIQNVALRNWRNGFLESFEINMLKIPDHLLQQTQLWVDERIEILRSRHFLKLMSHRIRKERINVAREVRLAELQCHENRLDSHLDAIYELVDNLPLEAAEFIKLDAPELYPLNWWLARIQADMNELLAVDPLDPETKRLKMCSYAFRLVKHRQLFMNSLDSAIEHYKKSIEHKIQVARMSNVRFVSQLKLFNEGGKYSAAEAVKTCSALVKGADSLESCVSRALDCVQHRRSQLLVHADQQIAPIQKVVDEVLKAQKGFLDRKKLGAAKK